jgi:hypothetical protein
MHASYLPKSWRRNSRESHEFLIRKEDRGILADSRGSE